MPIDPVKIPQNVYIEDRIVGPLTLRQTLLMTVGCGFSYAIYSMLTKSYGNIGIPLTVICWIPGVLSAAFALIKVNDLTLMRICFLMLEKANKPSVRVFEPRTGIDIGTKAGVTIKETVKKDEPVVSTPVTTQNHSRFEQLSAVVDQAINTDEKALAVDVDPSDAIVPVRSVTPVNPSRIKADDSSSAASPLFQDILPPTRA